MIGHPQTFREESRQSVDETTGTAPKSPIFTHFDSSLQSSFSWDCSHCNLQQASPSLFAMPRLVLLLCHGVTSSPAQTELRSVRSKTKLISSTGSKTGQLEECHMGLGVFAMHVTPITLGTVAACLVFVVKQNCSLNVHVEAGGHLTGAPSNSVVHMPGLPP